LDKIACDGTLPALSGMVSISGFISIGNLAQKFLREVTFFVTYFPAKLRKVINTGVIA